jgi:hypothetical protein
VRAGVLLAFGCLALAGATATAQTPPEVLQLVTFTFLPGKGSEAIALFRDRALPLYEQNEAMLRFRGLREMESPEPYDLIVVSAFRGMEGMDASNRALRVAAERAGTSIGALYGAIGALSTRHTDQFVEMLTGLQHGDPIASRLVALVSYRLTPGAGPDFEDALRSRVIDWERANGVPANTGRFLISDGWQYLRLLGFDSLGDFQEYWTRVGPEAGYDAIDRITVSRKVIVAGEVRALAVR